jgi:hypothetical protein
MANEVSIYAIAQAGLAEQLIFYQAGFYTSLLLFMVNELCLRQYKQRHRARLEADLGIQADGNLHSTDLALRYCLYVGVGHAYVRTGRQV